MKIYYIYSRNKLIGSRLISWASGLLIKDLEKIPSHVAVLVEGKKFSLVFESVLSGGVRIVPFTKWLEKNEICYQIEETRDVSPFGYINSLWGKGYDYPGIIYFAWRFVLYFLFKAPFPKTNRLESKSRFFCNELVGEMYGYKNYSMVTPAKMCSDMLKDKI